jgi:hypothetical protein
LPIGAVGEAEIVNVVETVWLFWTKRMPDPRDTDIPRVGGRSNSLRLTKPLRPLRLLTVTVEELDAPWKTVSELGWTFSEKSNAVTRTVTKLVTFRPPPEPVSVTK